MHKLERHRGHFYNWYDTRTLEPLRPMYVSTVDSGNLAGHLLTLARRAAGDGGTLDRSAPRAVRRGLDGRTLDVDRARAAAAKPRARAAAESTLRESRIRGAAERFGRSSSPLRALAGRGAAN